MSDILQIQDLSLQIPNGRERTRVLQDVNLAVEKGEIHGLIGESGCGKTMLSRVILGLTDSRSWSLTGRILYEEKELLGLPAKERRAMAGRCISYISQDPLTALNPLYSVGEQIAEMLRYHRGRKRREAALEAAQLLERVGLAPGWEQAKRYPHQFSGGQLQRICIAMAIACGPSLLIADEPTTALDVTTQAQILKLLCRLQAEDGLSILLITHDFGVIAQTCQRVSVMEKGRIVEEGPTEEIFQHPAESYTRRLIESALKKERGMEYGEPDSGASSAKEDL